MPNIRQGLIRLAYTKPETRPYLMPMLREAFREVNREDAVERAKKVSPGGRGRGKKNDIPSFDEWVKTVPLKSPATGKSVSFSTLEKLDSSAASAIREKYNAKVKKFQEEDEGIAQSTKALFEDEASWQKRVKENQELSNSMRKTNLDKEFTKDMQDLLNKVVADDQEASDFLAKLEVGTSLDDMETPDLKQYRKILDKATETYPKDKIADYNKLIGGKDPVAVIDGSLATIGKARKRVAELQKEGMDLALLDIEDARSMPSFCCSRLGTTTAGSRQLSLRRPWPT